MKPSTLPSIAAGLHATKSIGICARLVVLAGLEELLRSEGRYTLFAPTDSAFNDLPPGTLAALESNPAELRALLEYHIISVDREIAEIREGKLSTLEGSLITSSVTDDGLRLDHANTCGSPLRCGNGVIHQIDAVLFPGVAPPAAQIATKDSPWSGRRRSSPAAASLPSTAAQAAEAMFNSPPGSA
jgi:uncharacterized surface protein with fasciclin (FAS1) repeats